MLFKTAVVTGCGGDIGYGIGKIIRQERLAERLVGCDMHERHPWFRVFDCFERVPGAAATEYISEMVHILEKHRSDVLIPMSEAEIRRFFEKGELVSFCGFPLVLPNLEALEAGLDKYVTAEFLKRQGLLHPWTVKIEDGPPPEYPCIVKQRRGSGSKGMARIGADDYGYWLRKQPDSILQELLLPDDEEYTCGLYRTRSGEIRHITFKRWLGGGHTVYGEVCRLAVIDELLEEIARGLCLQGSINVQLRLTQRGPMVFEINPRFSSTVVFRHLLGFQDLAWSLQELAGQEPGPYIYPRQGTRFYRVSEELIKEDV